MYINKNWLLANGYSQSQVDDLADGTDDWDTVTVVDGKKNK